jgi:hypothetical protein
MLRTCRLPHSIAQPGFLYARRVTNIAIRALPHQPHGAVVCRALLIRASRRCWSRLTAPTRARGGRSPDQRGRAGVRSLGMGDDGYHVVASPSGSSGRERPLIPRPNAQAALGATAAGPLDRPACHQGFKSHGLMPLPRRQPQGHEVSPAFGAEVDFGAAPSLAAAERFGVRAPFFAPAACWWARTIVPSTTWRSQSSWPAAPPCCWTTAKSRSQTPAWRQR